MSVYYIFYVRLVKNSLWEIISKRKKVQNKQSNWKKRTQLFLCKHSGIETLDARLITHTAKKKQRIRVKTIQIESFCHSILFIFFSLSQIHFAYCALSDCKFIFIVFIFDLRWLNGFARFCFLKSFFYSLWNIVRKNSAKKS